MSNRLLSRFVALLLTLCLPVQVAARVTGRLEALDGHAVGQRTDIEFIVKYDNPDTLRAGDAVHFEFSDDYGAYFAQYSGERDISESCMASFGLLGDLAGKLACTVRSQDKTIIAKLLGPADPEIGAVGVRIGDMILPGKVKPSVVYVELRSSSGQTYATSERSGPRAFSITPTVATLSSAALSNSNETVGGRGKLTVTIRTANPVDGGADIRMQFPKWPGGGSYVEAAATVCSLDRNSPSNIASGATCSLDTGGSSYDVLLVRRAFSSDVPAGRRITFVVAGVRNHPSLRGVSGIGIQTQTTEGYPVDQRLGNGFAPRIMATAPASNYRVSMTATVSQRVPLTLSLRVLNPCRANTEIKVVFPPEIDASLLASVTLPGSGSTREPKTRMQASSGGRVDTVIIEDAFDRDQWPGARTVLRFADVVAPASDAPTSPFRFELAEVDGSERYGIERNKAGVTVRAKAAELTAYELSASTRTVFAALDAGLSVSFAGRVRSSSLLSVVYPSGFGLNPGNNGGCSVSLDEGAYAGSCTVTAANRTITIRDFATREYDFSSTSRGRTIRIRLTQLLVNPPSEEPVDGFTIHLRDGHAHTVARYDASKFAPDNMYTAIEAQLDQFSVRSLNQVTGLSSTVLMEMAILAGQTFTGLQMTIKLPKEVDFAATSVGCRRVAVLDQHPACSLVTEQGSTLLKVVLQGKGQSTRLTGPTKISFYIDYLRNPYSTARSSSFRVQLRDANDYKIASQDTNITLRVSQGSAFEAVAITPASKVNGAATTYRFQVTLKNPLPPGSVLTVTAPPEVIFSPSVGSRVPCVGAAELAERISCIWQRNQTLVTLDTVEEMESGQVLDFSLPLVRNPPSMKSSSSFALKAEYGAGVISIDNCCHRVQNTEAATITEATVSVGSIGLSSSYNISFTAVNPIPASGHIRVTFPPEVKRVDGKAVTCTAIAKMTTSASGRLDCTFDDASRELTISLNAPQPTKLAFAVVGFKSPDTFTLEKSFQIRTFTAAWDRIDQVTNGVGTTSRCQKPCKSCLLKETTCTACYADAQLKYLQNNECYRDCGAGTYGAPSKDGALGGFVCYECASDCETCNGTASKCTRCADPEKLLMPDGSCRGKCRDGQYAEYSLGSAASGQSVSSQAARCVDCPAQCTQCLSPTRCLDCAAGYLFHNMTCVKTCPSDMIANPDKTTCIPCKKPCLSCAGTADKCTKCDLSANSKAPFLYGAQCLAKCPDRYFGELPDSSTCTLVQEDVIPFTFFVAAFLVAMAVGIMKLCSLKVWTKKMHYKNTVIALVSVVCQGNWLYILYLAIDGSYWQSSVILLFGIGCSYVLNLVFFFLYLKVMRHDEYYDRWRQGRKLGEGVLVAAALLTSFQLYRLVFQQLSQSIKLNKEEDQKKKELEEQQEQEELQEELNEVSLRYIPQQEVQHEGGEPVADQAAAGAGSRVRARGSPVHPEGAEPPAPAPPIMKQYKTQDENTVKSIFNTLSIVMISCVLLPVLVQNIYSLTITHPGQKIFWEDIESLAMTFGLLCMMLYDAYKKTKKVEGSKLKKPVPASEARRLWAGIPADLANKQAEARRADDMLGTPQELKRLRDVLTLMLRNQVPAGGADFGHEDADADEVDASANIGKLRQHFRVGRLRNLDNAGAPVQAQDRHLEMTASHRQDQTDASVVTEENLLGTSDRLLIKKQMRQMDEDDLFGASGAMFRRNERPQGQPEPYQSTVDDDGDDANVEGTLESPNVLGRRAGAAPVDDDADLDENIDSDEKNDEDRTDRNRRNIHGDTDSVIYRNLGIQQEDLRESQARPVAEFADHAKKSLIQGRLRGDDITRGPSHMDVSNTDVSALHDVGGFRQEESHGKLSTFKSVPNHFSLVSADQDVSQNVTVDVDPNPFARKRLLDADLDRDEGDVDHEHSLEREGGAPTAGILTTTNRLSTQDAIAVHDSTHSAAASRQARRPTLPQPPSVASLGYAGPAEEEGAGFADTQEESARTSDPMPAPQGPDQAQASSRLALPPVFADPSSQKTMAKKANKQRVHTTIIEEEEKDTEFDRRQSQLVSADAEGAHIGSALDLSLDQRPEEATPSLPAEPTRLLPVIVQAKAPQSPTAPPAPEALPDPPGQVRKQAVPPAESGEQEIADEESVAAPGERRASSPHSMRSVPVPESSIDNVDGKGEGVEEEQMKQSDDESALGSAKLMMSVNTSQLTVDGQHHPVEKIDEMQFKMNLVDPNAKKGRTKAAKEKKNCTNAYQSGSMLGGRGRGRAPAGRAISEADRGLRQSQTTEDNFKNVAMLDNDLKKFKKATEPQVDSKRQAEIQNLKGGTNPLRQTYQMYSNGSIGKRKNDMGEFIKNSHSSHHSRDRDRPKTAELDAGDGAKKKDLTKMSHTNVMKNTKWISSYDHSNNNAQSRQDDQSLYPRARDSSAEKSAHADEEDKSNLGRSAARLQTAQEQRDPFKLLYNRQADGSARRLLSKQQSQSLESMPAASEHRGWRQKPRPAEKEEEPARRPSFRPSLTLRLQASQPGTPGQSGSPRRLTYLQQQANAQRAGAPSTTLAPLDIADPYNPDLAQRLGLKGGQTRSQAQSRTSQKGRGEGLLREAGPLGSGSQTGRKLQSNFSSRLQQPRRESREESDQRSDPRQRHGDLRSTRDQYDSAQVRVTVPSIQGNRGHEMPFLNVKGKNTQAVQHYEKIMNHQSGASLKRSQDGRDKRSRAGSREGSHRSRPNLTHTRELERGRSQDQLGLVEDGPKQRKAQRQKTAQSGRVSGADASLPAGHQPAPESSRHDYLDQQLQLMQNTAKLSSKGRPEHSIQVQELCSDHHRPHGQKSLAVSESSRPPSSYSKVPPGLKSAASASSRHHHHHGGNVHPNHPGCGDVLKASASQILQATGHRSAERRAAAQRQQQPSMGESIGEMFS